MKALVYTGPGALDYRKLVDRLITRWSEENVAAPVPLPTPPTPPTPASAHVVETKPAPTPAPAPAPTVEVSAPMTAEPATGDQALP